MASSKSSILRVIKAKDVPVVESEMVDIPSHRTTAKKKDKEAPSTEIIPRLENKAALKSTKKSPNTAPTEIVQSPFDNTPQVNQSAEIITADNKDSIGLKTSLLSPEAKINTLL